jgi:exodeoxyribonuclease VII small subunit
MKTFEDKMTRLEEINLILKDQKSTFSEMTALFEEGMKLSESLEKELNNAEQKILLVKEQIQGKTT